MRPIEIRPNIYWVGINDRSTELFEGLWPIHDQGVSYNSYLIRDKKQPWSISPKRPSLMILWSRYAV